MSNTQGSQEQAKRDWMNEPITPTVGLATLNMDANDIAVVCDWAESIVRRELAGEMEKMLIRMPTREGRVFNEAIEKVLALLSPHQNDAEGGE